MKAIIRYDAESHPPLLTMHIHGAPHEREARETLQKYRDDLTWIAKRSIANEVDMPIDHPIDLYVTFTNPNSPDINHTLTALFCALDEKSLKGPAILKDDRHIQKVTMHKYYPNEATKRDGIR